ncbi:MAG: hypothetical protein QXW70_03975 [Candidatus Anstonellales archaeon]
MKLKAIFLFFLAFSIVGCLLQQDVQNSQSQSRLPTSYTPVLESSSITELMEKNIPLDCSIKITSGDQIALSKIYIYGYRYRYTPPSSSLSGHYQAEIIFVNNSLYIKLPNIPRFSQCSWVQLTNFQDIAGLPASGLVAGAKLSCTPTNISDVFFNPKGTICSEKDIALEG